MAGLQVIANYASNSPLENNNYLDSDTSIARRSVRMDKRDNYYPAVILLYFLVSVGISLALVPILTLISIGANKDSMPATNVSLSTDNLSTIDSVNASYYNYRFTIIKVLRCAFSCIVAAVFIWLVTRKSKLVENSAVWWPISTHDGDEVREIESDVHQFYHSSLFGAAMFLGVGSVVMFTLLIITSAQCAVYEQNHEQMVSGSFILSVLNNVIFLFLLISQLVFFHTYNKAVFINPVRRVFHFAMALGIASNIWNWLGFTFTAPLWEHVEGEQFHDEAHWCKGDETEAMRYLSKTQRYLSILFPEFSIMAISLHYCHWTTMINFGASFNKTRSNDRTVFTNQASTGSDNESGALLSENTNQHERNPTNHEILVDTVKTHPYVTLISTILGVVYLSMKIGSHYLAINDRIQNRYKETFAIVQLISEASIFVPAAVVILQCLRRLKNVSPLRLPLSGNDYLLIFASAWALVYDLLQMFAIADMLKHQIYVSLAVVGVGVTLVFSTQTCLQTLFLITIHRRRVDNQKAQDETRSCLIFLTFANAVNWLITGLTHEWAVDSKFVPIIAIGFDHIGFDSDISGRNLTIGSTIILIVYPMLSLYRFHSTVICYEMLKTQHPKVQPSHPTLVLNSGSEDEFSEQ